MVAPWNIQSKRPPLLNRRVKPLQICEKCYKAVAVLIPLQLGSGGAAAKCFPACYERIFGKEELEDARKVREDQESKKPDHLS